MRGVKDMGNIHKTLENDNFNNSKYIEVLNKELGCDNFRKNYPKEFEIMLDIFQKFIELYNCFFADSNGENIYRIKKSKKLLAQLFKMKDRKEEEVIGIKYSVRDIKNLPDKEARSIYNLMKEWYFTIYHMEKTETETLTQKDLKKK